MDIGIVLSITVGVLSLLVMLLLEAVQPSLKVSQYNKQLLTDILLAVEVQRSIQGYRELVKLILNLETYD